jgi:hypothetical protein
MKKEIFVISASYTRSVVVNTVYGVIDALKNMIIIVLFLESVLEKGIWYFFGYF